MKMQSLKKIRAETAGQVPVQENQLNSIGTENNFADYFTSMSKFKYGTDLSVIIYFICMKTLAEAIGKLKNRVCQATENGIVECRDNPLNELINIRPNPFMTAASFYSTIEYHRNHYGNAFALCRRNGRGEPLDMWIMHPRNTTILIDDSGIFQQDDTVWIKYIDHNTCKTYIYPYADVCHYRTTFLSSDGISGLPIRDILRNTLNEAKASQKMQNEMYQNGITGRAVLEYTGDLSVPLREKLKKEIAESAEGIENAGKIIPIPLGMKLQPLDVSLSDMQFKDIKQYSDLQIAAGFGLKPNQINDYTKSSYNNSEAQNISFYVDTLLYILQIYEQEESFKLLTKKDRQNGFFVKRNVKGIFRTDIKQQSESLRSLVQGGIYSVNDARMELDKTKVPGGDEIIVNGTFIKLKDVGKQYGVGKDNGENE